ncbi:MAG: HPr(Ser) kinase/phosphatase [Oscillospiraceae bacterium]|nr:HPr(Ser) kinase/phosphatase [Oscillospiraceae bacterium]
MPQKTSIKLSKLVELFDLEILHPGADFENILIINRDVMRPALPLAGFFNYFDSERIQVFGRTETAYLDTLSPKRRMEILDQLFYLDVPAFIITSGLEPCPDLMAAALKYNRTILRTSEPTHSFMAQFFHALSELLAPTTTVHGVLLEVYGEGILLTGESGMGKSEIAIELIKRGHRLVADDAVECRLHNNRSIIGTSPDLIRYYMELRGIGVVDVRRLFGMSAVRDRQRINLIICLKPWDEVPSIERLGETTQYSTILNVEVPTVTIPVTPGRNLASIIEVAAMNQRQKDMGFNAVTELNERLDRYFAARAAEQETGEQP